MSKKKTKTSKPKPQPQGLPLYHPVFLIATWFGVGKIKKAPGTFGSLAALPFAWALHQYTGVHGVLYACIALFLIGIFVSDIYMQRMGSGHDPKEIVVDEVVGMWLLTLIFPPSINAFITAFLLFRLFDIWKPWPIRLVDRRIGGGLGVMSDDFLAAFIPGVLFALLLLGCKMLGLSHWLTAITDFLYPSAAS